MLPPFTTSVWPVMKDAIGEARKSAAWQTSSGSPLRPSGLAAEYRFSMEAPGSSLLASEDGEVLIPPGAMAFILI